MSRKFRELIPLFAIALMIIGAVALLIAMNSKGKTKKIVNKEENKKTEVVEEQQEIKEETEVSEPVAEIDVTEKDVTEDKIDEKTETKTSGTKSSVQKLVDTGLRTSNLGGTTTTETKKETSNVVINTAPSQTAVQQQPAKTQTTTTKPATTTQKVVKPSYNVYKTVSGNGVKVEFAYGNKMIITSNGKEKVMDIGQVSKATIKNGNLYVELANGDTRSYSINGATLNLTKSLTGAVQTVTTSGYAYVLKDNGTVFLYNTIDGIINPSEIAILRGTSPVSEIISANGKNVTVELTTGKEKSYIYNGNASFDVK